MSDVDEPDAAPHPQPRALCDDAALEDRPVLSRVARAPPFYLSVHPIETVGELRRKLAALFDVAPSQTRLVLAHRQLVDDHRAVSELGVVEQLGDHHELQVVFSRSSQSHEQVQEAVVLSVESVAQDCACDGALHEKFVVLLFEMLDTMERQRVSISGTAERCTTARSRETSRGIWDLLQLIPTQPDLLQRVTTASSAAEWSTLLSCSLDRAMYALQIVDALLQPSVEVLCAQRGQIEAVSARFRKGFVESEGFALVLRLLMDGSLDGDALGRGNLMALRVVKFALFEGCDDSHARPAALDCAETMSALLRRLVALAWAAHGKEVASGEAVDNARAAEDAVVDALGTIGCLLRHPTMLHLFVSSSEASHLATSVLLRGACSKSRQRASELLLSSPKLTKVAFDWLLDSLAKTGDTAATKASSEFFQTLHFILARHPTAQDPLDTRSLQRLGRLLHCSLVARAEDAVVLLGCLGLLADLATLDCEGLFLTDRRGDELLELLLSTLVFPLPEKVVSGVAERQTRVASVLKTAALTALRCLAFRSPKRLRAVLKRVHALTLSSAPELADQWGYELIDNKLTTPSSGNLAETAHYVGLRNQGCTCYMNSLLQQVFMVPALRTAILDAHVAYRKQFLASEWPPAELVGCSVRLFTRESAPRDATVLEWRDGRHTISITATGDHERIDLSEHFSSRSTTAGVNAPQAVDCNGPATDASLIVEVVRSPNGPLAQHRSSFVPAAPESSDERSTVHVLQQIQRTFCFLQSSKKKQFDPQRLVEACKCLNLNYSVYQQNDASEFADKLFEKLEEALKASTQKKALQRCFGGRVVNQKIPKEGSLPTTNKEEPFIKIELSIRGKESLEASLGAFVEGEVMDGDNKVECEDGVRRAIVRRTCFGRLPNLLILHLKRFDLDYTTFETVKLNSRCAFPTRLDLRPFTKEGIEAGEAQQAATEDAPAPAPVPPPEDDSCLYDLKGVLVHAGVAQGGHYYSLIKECEGDSWYRFDDEDVTFFDKQHIESHCFGGTTLKTTSNLQGVSTSVEHEKLANALMLFYEKVVVDDQPEDEEALLSVNSARTGTAESVQTESCATEAGAVCADCDASVESAVCAEAVCAPEQDASAQPPTPPSPPSLEEEEESGRVLADGRGVFEGQVWNANVSFLSLSHLFDASFQRFLRATLADAIAQPPTGEKALRLEVVQVATNFLLDVAVHARDRPKLEDWLALLERAYCENVDACKWLLRELASPTRGWLSGFLLRCVDASARQSFVRLTLAVVHALIPHLGSERQRTCEPTGPPPSTREQSSSVELTSFLARLAHVVKDVPQHWGSSDEFFVLLRDLALSHDAVRHYLTQLDLATTLSVLVMGDRAPLELRKHVYPRAQHHPALSAHCTADLLCLLEALTALVGAAPLKKIRLLEESSYCATELSPHARRALTSVFYEHARDGGMDLETVARYMQRCGLERAVTAPQLVAMLHTYETLADGRLGLFGFLDFYRDTAKTAPRQVWHDLSEHGFGTDLVRRARCERASCDSPRGAEEAAKRAPVETRPLELSSASRAGLTCFAFYEVASEVLECSALVILSRVCFKQWECSALVLQRCLERVAVGSSGWSASGSLSSSNALTAAADATTRLLSALLAIDDNLRDRRVELVMLSPENGILESAFDASKVASLYPHDYHSTQKVHRYIATMRELHKLPNVAAWLDARKQQWAWVQSWMRSSSVMEDYLESGEHAQRSAQSTHRLSQNVQNQHVQNQPGDLGPDEDEEDDDDDDEDDLDRQPDEGTLRRGGGGGGPALLHNANHSSDDSEYNDVLVSRAGTEACNGRYCAIGSSDGVAMYGLDTQLAGERVRFTLYRCKLNNGTRRWYVSIVPANAAPGTNCDQDFYSAASQYANDPSEVYPPGTCEFGEWTTCKPVQGQRHAARDPPPNVQAPGDDDSELEGCDNAQESVRVRDLSPGGL